MKKIGLKFMITLLAVYGVAYLLPTVIVRDSVSALLMVIVLFLIGLILKPIMMVIGLPISVLTVGVFLLVINAWLLLIADALVKGVELGGFLNALLIALVIAVLKIMVIDFPSKPVVENPVS